MSNRKSTGRKNAKKAAAARGASSGRAKGTARKAAKARAAKSGRKKSSARKAGKASAGAATRPVAPVLTADEKRAIVARYVAAYNARDTATILSLYDARATMSDPIGLPPARGHAAIAELYKMGFDMNVSIAPDGAIRCAGNSVAFPLIASSPSSRLDVIDVFDFGKNGKIVEMRAYWGPDNLVGDLAVRQ